MFFSSRSAFYGSTFAAASAAAGARRQQTQLRHYEQIELGEVLTFIMNNVYARSVGKQRREWSDSSRQTEQTNLCSLTFLHFPRRLETNASQSLKYFI